MREIKFRLWNNVSQKMELNTYNIFEQWPNVYIMQFTWLLDKNWVEIYEGDILRIRKQHEKNEKIVECIWWNIWWWLFQEYKSPYSLIDSEEFSYYDSEILWNIYESKELLTK